MPILGIIPNMETNLTNEVLLRFKAEILAFLIPSLLIKFAIYSLDHL